MKTDLAVRLRPGTLIIPEHSPAKDAPPHPSPPLPGSSHPCQDKIPDGNLLINQVLRDTFIHAFISTT